MKKNRLAISVMFGAVLVFLATVGPAHAKEGFHLGLQIPYNMIEGDFDNTTMPEVDAGGGFGFIIGYGITPAFSLELDWAVSGHKSAGADIGFGEFSLNGKYAFQETSDIQPFLLGGLGVYTLGDDSLTLGGTGINLGLGVDFYSSPNLSWGIAVVRKLITYDDIVKSDVPLTLTKDIKGDTTSLRFDVTYHF